MIVKRHLRRNLKSGVNQRLIQADASIVASGYDQDIIKEENDNTNDMIERLADPDLHLHEFKTDGKCYLNYICLEEANFWVELKGVIK